MSRLPQHELFGPERPIRSDYTREVSYARRRILTVAVIGLLLVGGVYMFWGGSKPHSTEIPTIKAEGEYKQKPSEPGGIDIPHQDVRVYDQLEGKGGAAPAVEHLLPPPETPKESPRAPAPDMPSPPAAAPVSSVTTPTPVPAQPKPMPSAPKDVAVAPAPAMAPVPQKNDLLQGLSTVKPIETTAGKDNKEPVAPPPQAAPSPVSEPAAAPVKAVAGKPLAPPKAVAKAPPAPKEEMTIEKVIQKMNAKAPVAASAPEAATVTAPAKAAGSVAIQLASIPDEDEARATMQKLKQKHAAVLGGAQLRVVRADLGEKGVYYRIQSQSLAKDEASRICSSLKKSNAGCIVVGK